MIWSTLFLCAVVVVMVSGQQRICMQVEPVESSPDASNPARTHLRGVPGKRGQKGEVGPPGRGIKGDPGEIDYEQIFSKMNETYIAFQDNMQMKIEKLQHDMNARFTAIQTRESDFASLWISNLGYPRCHVFHNNRCFRIVMRSSRDVNVETSRSLCQQMGEKPANIYSEDQLTSVMSHIRENMPSGGNNVFVWTGMEVKTGSVTLYDGSSAPYVKWRSSDFPQAGQPNIYLRVRTDASSVLQGFETDPPTSALHGVVCEI